MVIHYILYIWCAVDDVLMKMPFTADKKLLEPQP